VIHTVAWNSMWAGGSAALAAGAMLSAQKLVLTCRVGVKQGEVKYPLVI